MAWRFRFGFWSARADWKLARDISRDSWAIRSNAEVPYQINKALDKSVRETIPMPTKEKPETSRYLKMLEKNTALMQNGIRRYKLDFQYIEEIKYNASILESERMKALAEFEKILAHLHATKKIFPGAYQKAQSDLHSIKSKLSSRLADDKEMARRLDRKI